MKFYACTEFAKLTATIKPIGNRGEWSEWPTLCVAHTPDDDETFVVIEKRQ